MLRGGLGLVAACHGGATSNVDDAGRDAALPRLPVAMVATPDWYDPTLGPSAEPADYACLGQPQQHEPIAELRFTGCHWSTGGPTCVRVFPDGTIGDDRCADFMFAPDGGLRPGTGLSFGTELAADAWFEPDWTGAALRLVWHGVRLHPDAGLGTAAAYLWVFDRSLLSDVAISTDHLQSARRGLVVAVVYDCRGRGVTGALLATARLDGTPVRSGQDVDDPTIGWLEGDCAWPVRDRLVTPRGGTAMLANLPVDEGAVVVQAWARPEGDDAPRLVSCATVTSESDTHTHVSLWPLDDDDPPCPGASP